MSVKPDEQALRAAMVEAASTPSHDRPSPRQIAERLNIPAKRADYIFDKWVGRGWYDYGVCIDMGWLTPEGLAEFSTCPAHSCDIS